MDGGGGVLPRGLVEEDNLYLKTRLDLPSFDPKNLNLSLLLLSVVRVAVCYKYQISLP